MNIDKTVTFKVDDKTVQIADLAAPIRKQFEVFDAYRQTMLDAALAYEMANAAVTYKTLELQKLIRDMLSQKEETGDKGSNE